MTNTAYTLAIAGGDNQSAHIGAAFALPLQLTVLDDAGNPASGVTVTFTAPSSGASTSPATFTASTGADGAASVTATANSVRGGPYAVTAAASGGSASFNLTNTAYTLAVAGGDNQSAHVGTAFALPLQVLVVDDANNSVPGVVVSFTAAEWSYATSNPKTFTATTAPMG